MGMESLKLKTEGLKFKAWYFKLNFEFIQWLSFYL